MSIKGQITVEYLLLAIIGLAVISISAYALAKIKSSFDTSVKISRFSSDAENMYENMKEVCVLGKGNARTMKINEQIKISKDNGVLILKSSEGRIVKKLGCDLEETSIGPGQIEIYWDEGMKRIRIQEK